MRRGRGNGGMLGCLMIGLGIIILLALVLPPGFWWFILAGALIVCGFCCARRF